MRRWMPWLIVGGLTAAVTVISLDQSLRRYWEFRSAWPWDLAYLNQLFWAPTHGLWTITVRPIAPYTVEGPWFLRMSSLSPMRLAILPFWLIWPRPETWIVFQQVVLWGTIPTAYRLVRSESGSETVAVAAVALVPLTPLMWPWAWNDFRELQLAPPFLLTAVQGIRARDRRLAGVGIAGLLACRQEFALVVATLAAMPPRVREPWRKTGAWGLALIAIGVGWSLLFLGYLWAVDRHAPWRYLNQFSYPKAGPAETARTALELLGYGMGSWALLALLAPVPLVLGLPWIWSIANGRWSIRQLSVFDSWHFVRYAIPGGTMVLAAGLIGFARLGTWLLGRRRGGWMLAAAWIVLAAGLVLPRQQLVAWLGEVYQPIAAEDVDDLWAWIDRVEPEDGVVVAYELSAPLAARRWVYSYGLLHNEPPGFPRLGPEIRWIFARSDEINPLPFLAQGFETVHAGPTALILRRTRPGAPLRWSGGLSGGR